MRRAPPRAAAAGIAVLLAVACAPLLPSPDPATTEGEWAQARDGATRSAKLYDLLDTVAFATATWQSEAVRLARVSRVAEWKGLGAAERDALLATERAASEQGEEFLVAFFTANRAANDLARSPGTWQVTLQPDGGAPVAPAKVEWVRSDPTLRMLYPHVTDFDTLYRVRFPRPPGGPLGARPFALRFAGALGRMELVFAP